MKLLVVRHGECIANVQGLVAGSRNDSPLTPIGVQQATAAAHSLIGQPIEQIIASPLSRAYRTAEIIRDMVVPGQAITTDPAFIERDSGVATGTDRYAYLDDLHAGKVIEGAESLQQLYDRVQEGLYRIDQSLGCTLIATHGGTARAIECIIAQRPAADISQLVDLANGEVREFSLV